MNTATITQQYSFQQLLDSVKQLTPKEKQLVNDALWDENMPVPIEHQVIVQQRIKDTTPEKMLDWDEVKTKFK
jgi:hypothetical protein